MCEDPVTAMVPGSRDEAEFALENIHISWDLLCACPAVREFWYQRTPCPCVWMDYAPWDLNAKIAGCSLKKTSTFCGLWAFFFFFCLNYTNKIAFCKIILRKHLLYSKLFFISFHSLFLNYLINNVLKQYSEMEQYCTFKKILFFLRSYQGKFHQYSKNEQKHFNNLFQ